VILKGFCCFFHGNLHFEFRAGTLPYFCSTSHLPDFSVAVRAFKVQFHEVLLCLCFALLLKVERFQFFFAAKSKQKHFRNVSTATTRQKTVCFYFHDSNLYFLMSFRKTKVK